MMNDIEVYYQRVKKALCRREVLQTIASIIIVVCIFHFITRPKIEYREVVHKEYVDKIVEVEKIVETPIKEEEEYVNDDYLEFDEVFKKYRKQLGAGKLFFWRKTLYTTNYEEEE